MANFRRKYRVISHEDSNSEEVGLVFVLKPAGNLADLAAMKTLIENVDPELAADLREHVAFIERHPDRKLTSYGKKCLPHITHEELKAHATKRMSNNEHHEA